MVSLNDQDFVNRFLFVFLVQMTFSETKVTPSLMFLFQPTCFKLCLLILEGEENLQSKWDRRDGEVETAPTD